MFNDFHIWKMVCNGIYIHPLLHGAGPFFRNRQLCSYSRTSQHFMEPIVSVLCSQEPSTGPCPEPDQSNSYHAILSWHLYWLIYYNFHISLRMLPSFWLMERDENVCMYLGYLGSAVLPNSILFKYCTPSAGEVLHHIYIKLQRAKKTI
jgi:hypothetical protein